MPRKNHKEIDYKYNLTVYFNLLKNYKLLFFSVLFVIFLVEVGSLIDKYLFKIVLDKGADFLNQHLSESQFINLLILLSGIFLAIITIRSIAKWLYIHLLNNLESNLMADLKRKFFNHVLGLSYQFHTTHKTGSLISRLVRGGRSIESMTDILTFNLAPLVFQLLVVSIALFYFSWVSVITIIIVMTTFIIYSLYIQNLQQNYSTAANDTEDKEKANVSDFLTNIESIKYFGKENIIKNRFAKITQETKAAYMKYWNYYRWLDGGQLFIISFGTLFVIYFPLVKFIHHEMSIGTLAFIYAAYGNLISPMFGFVRGIRDYYKVMADFDSLFQYGKIKNEIKDKPKSQDIDIKEGTIEFKNISFSYQKRNIFHNFNLKIEKNQKIALVGHSGSGKTTLIKLLYRLYDVQHGEIKIDKKNIKDYKQESLRSSLSIVPQECVLFDDTIYNNIAFSNSKATKEQIVKAIRFSHLDKVIKNFPSKENTIVGERGVRLSGGEKQRVSIARALLANKKVLILDEATSALDSKTENEIQQDLEQLMKNRTTIIIAHRLSTIMKADKIVVLNKGKIVQMGNHKELITEEGTYKELWNLQKGGYIR
jgi:ATP-binding cassette subfamily B protein